MTGVITIDNFGELPKLMHLEEGRYYKFFLVIRKKDVPNGVHPLITTKTQENIIRFWLVDDEERFYRKQIFEMQFLLQAVPYSRLYMVLDPKSNKRTLQTMRGKLDGLIDQAMFDGNVNCRFLNRIVTSSTSAPESSDKGGRKYLIDVDTKDDVELEDCKTQLDEIGAKYVVIPSKNGYHIICDRDFDMTRFCGNANVTIKKDAACLIAMSEPTDE